MSTLHARLQVGLRGRLFGSQELPPNPAFRTLHLNTNTVEARALLLKYIIRIIGNIFIDILGFYQTGLLVLQMRILVPFCACKLDGILGHPVWLAQLSAGVELAELGRALVPVYTRAGCVREAHSTPRHRPSGKPQRVQGV